MNIGIFYISMSGNTKQVTDILHNEFTGRGFNVSSKNFMFETENEIDNIEQFDLIVFGSFTWGNGKLPKRMRDFLKYHLIDNKSELKTVALFGTGETQWTHFCRAVDEMEYHLKKYNIKVIDDKLKIEQSPYNQQEHKIIEFVENILKEMT